MAGAQRASAGPASLTQRENTPLSRPLSIPKIRYGNVSHSGFFCAAREKVSESPPRNILVQALVGVEKRFVFFVTGCAYVWNCRIL